MKLRMGMVVDPIRSTMTPKNGTESPITIRRAITRLRKTIRFHPKAAKFHKFFEVTLTQWNVENILKQLAWWVYQNWEGCDEMNKEKNFHSHFYLEK